MFDKPAPLTPLGHAQITGLGSVKSPVTPPARARYVIIQATGANVRWTDDGVDPTSSTGMQLASGNDMLYSGTEIKSLKFLQEAATGVINLAYYE